MAKFTDNNSLGTEAPENSQVASLKSVIAESRAENESAAVLALEPKRKRGRPRKNPAPEGLSGEPMDGFSGETAPVAELVDFSPQILQGIQVLGATAAHYYECDKLEVTEEEGTPVALSANECLNKYFPAVAAAESAPIWGLVISMGMLVGSKVMIYRADLMEKIAKKREKEDSKTADATPFVGSPFDVTAASTPISE